MSYTIVKHAAPAHWAYWFTENPEDGVGLFCSAHATHSGVSCALKELYTDLAEAEAACIRINEFNPSGGYAVCHVLPSSLPS